MKANVICAVLAIASFANLSLVRGQVSRGFPTGELLSRNPGGQAEADASVQNETSLETMGFNLSTSAQWRIPCVYFRSQFVLESRQRALTQADPCEP